MHDAKLQLVNLDDHTSIRFSAAAFRLLPTLLVTDYYLQC